MAPPLSSMAGKRRNDGREGSIGRRAAFDPIGESKQFFQGVKFIMASVSDPFSETSFGPKVKRPTAIVGRVRLIEDHEDIARLMSLHCHYNDGGWEGQGPSQMGPSADMFIENGVWDDYGKIGKAEGREAIRALFIRAKVRRLLALARPS